MSILRRKSMWSERRIFHESKRWTGRLGGVSDLGGIRRGNQTIHIVSMQNEILPTSVDAIGFDRLELFLTLDAILEDSFPKRLHIFFRSCYVQVLCSSL